jgi:hypothetical protein
MVGVGAANIVCIGLNHRLLPWYLSLPSAAILTVAGAIVALAGLVVWFMINFKRERGPTTAGVSPRVASAEQASS